MISNYTNKYSKAKRIVFGIIFALPFFFATQADASVLSPGNVSTCGEIASAGTYTLTTNVGTGINNLCFQVTSDNVLINGAGHTINGYIDGNGTDGDGDAVSPTSGFSYTISNATVTNNIQSSGAADDGVFGAGSGGTVTISNSIVVNVLSNGGDSNSAGAGNGGTINFNNSTSTGVMVSNGGEDGNGDTGAGTGGLVYITNSSFATIGASGGSDNGSGGGDAGTLSVTSSGNLNLSGKTLHTNGENGVNGVVNLYYTSLTTNSSTSIRAHNLVLNNVITGDFYGIFNPIQPGTIASCGILYLSGTYTLNSNVNSGGGTCFTIMNSGITIVGAGHTITGNIDGNGLAGDVDYGFWNPGNGKNFTLSNVTVTGGAVYSNGADDDGGNGAGNGGTVTIVAGSVISNAVSVFGGFDQGSEAYQGVGGSLVLTNSTINSSSNGIAAYTYGEGGQGSINFTNATLRDDSYNISTFSFSGTTDQGLTDISGNGWYYGDNIDGYSGTVTDRLGCTDSGYQEYNSEAVIDDGSCSSPAAGCTDPDATNYDPDATDDDGSCEYTVLGCTDENDPNYNEEATEDDGSCQYYYGCTDPDAGNYDSNATDDDGSCDYTVSGCTDPNDPNYDPDATEDDGSCQHYYGCTDPIASNYDGGATEDDGSCNYTITDLYFTGSNSANWSDPGNWNESSDESGNYPNYAPWVYDYGNPYDYVYATFDLHWGDAEQPVTIDTLLYVDGVIFGTSDIPNINNISTINDGHWTGANFYNSSDGSIYGGAFSGNNFSNYGYIGDGAGVFSNNGFVNGGQIEGGTWTGTNFSDDGGSISGGTGWPGLGCTDDTAVNYDVNAIYDDGSCEYHPTVSFTAPSAGTISGSSVSLIANASDDGDIEGVSFYIGSILIGSEDTDEPYGVTLNSTAYSNGSYTLYAVARDNSGYFATSTVVVSISNDLVVQPQNSSGPSGGSSGGGTTLPVLSNIITNVTNPLCPIGLICTPIVSPTICPPGLICTPITNTNNATNTPHYTFNYDLGIGAKSFDVKQLQILLNNKGMFVAKIGAGSPGKETTIFGKATMAALKIFQMAYGINPTGFFGPLTRALINSMGL